MNPTARRYSDADLKNALRAITLKGMSLKEVAKKHRIPPGEKKNSSGTDSTRALVAEVLPENHVTSSLCYIFRLVT